MKISASDFFNEYYGHPIDAIEFIHQHLRRLKKHIVWLVGDSSLDNKHWLLPDGGWSGFSEKLAADACNGYEFCLRPPKCIQDVAFHLNTLLPPEYGAINCAVEERAVSDGPSQHDTFVRENLQNGDIVIISIGGNDLALKSTLGTKLTLVSLLYLVPSFFIRNGYGLGLDYIFKTGVEERLKYICGSQKPSLVIPCSIYYPCLSGTGWAKRFLDLLSYQDHPEKIHLMIDTSHEFYTAKIDLGTDIPIAPVALSRVLDPENPEDYCQQVEPSVQGGRKMAEAFLLEIKKRGFI